MNLKALITDGCINLYTARLRSLLALLGIVVGTASVVAMMSGGKLAEHEALKQFRSLGTELLAISVRKSQEEMPEGELQRSLTVAQVAGLKDKVNGVQVVAPYVQLFQPIRFSGHELIGVILGVTREFSEVARVTVTAGRFISRFDGHNPYCVVGYGLYRQIEKLTLLNPIGQQIQIGNSLFTIIGIAKEWPESSFVYSNVNDSLMVPMAAALNFEKNIPITNILLRLISDSNIEKVKTQSQHYLHSLAPDEEFTFRSAKELIEYMTKQTKIFTIFLGLIGGISLCVGGIGVMNVMLISIVERKREIGIRRAVGATRSDIRSLFLTEALLISLIGGMLGVLLGVLISWAIAAFWNWSFTFFWLPSLTGFSVSAATGIFFGFYPAHKASFLDPIEALRSL